MTTAMSWWLFLACMVGVSGGQAWSWFQHGPDSNLRIIAISAHIGILGAWLFGSFYFGDVAKMRFLTLAPFCFVIFGYYLGQLYNWLAVRRKKRRLAENIRDLELDVVVDERRHSTGGGR